ncbi:deoxyribonuclease IV [Geobacter sp. DSM 9736]|uniref:deoxyribonuclease IV n=1 Tax=Geobacter sp. DSM 9736 TaxID=1277350 RepID=UPI000B510F3E|nr:deoxyribonuclease IV [Geobacter sp. DSM 9736]SNB46765.1 Endonuclease IV [Geobacter sp. DSM 9736]
MDHLGAHMSIAGGIYNAPERGTAVGCGVIQIFTQNTSRWQGKAVSDADAALFREKWRQSGLLDVASHDIYLINLASPPGELRDKSLSAFMEEMRRCARLGIGKIIMHPGAHQGDGEAAGIRRICEAFDLLIESVPEYAGAILLETTAGQGSSIGHTFEQLQSIISGSAYPDRFGVCVDTCHIFAAGYDIGTEDGYHRTFEEFDRIIGLSRLQAFHLNDTKKGLSSRVDRHEHIGKGALGLTPFRLLMNDQRFATVPKFLETPKGDNDEMDVINLKTLRDLIR